MKSTSLRINSRTLEMMRVAATELAAERSIFLGSDDERISALVEHWHQTKHANNLTPAAQDAAGVSTPSPRQG